MLSEKQRRVLEQCSPHNPVEVHPAGLRRHLMRMKLIRRFAACAGRSEQYLLTRKGVRVLMGGK